MNDGLAAKSEPLVSIVTVVYNRAAPLSSTIDSVFLQEYSNIEYIVIDGGSSDDTIDIIKQNEEKIDSWSSEPDEGIYDAINKGIGRAKGDYILILHAADLYEPTYVGDLVAEAAHHPGAVIYSGYKHGARIVESETMSDGVYLHHMGINHSSFLVPAEVYRAVGCYSTAYKIVSDAIWMRLARDAQIEFHRIEGHGLSFAEGGLSSAKSEAHRALVIGEWVKSYRIFFPFLPEDVAEAIYLYRFEEQYAGRILEYVRSYSDNDGIHAKFALFRRSLCEMLAYIWSLRSVNVNARGFEIRWDLCLALQMDLRKANLQGLDYSVSSYLDMIDAFKARRGAGAVTLHYLEVFSRASETFIPDLINRMSAHDGQTHVILCDKRILAALRPFPNIIAIGYSEDIASFYRRLVERLIDEIGVSRIVFHFSINAWRLLSRLSPRFQELPAIYMTHGIDVFDLYRPSPWSDFTIKVAAKLPNVRFTAVSSYLRDALVEVGVPFHRVTIVHNVVHDRFFHHHMPGRSKADQLRQSGYAARLVNIGRLVRWKGQADIVRAIGLLRRDGVNVHLTLVYGEEAADLDHLRGVMSAEGVTDRVSLRPFVDFEAEPAFLNGFDILVSASKFTNGPGARSETFGMSILEGIAAGLPVVVTDAGGQPEVAGTPNEYVRIARHGNPESIAAEIRMLIETDALRGDNRAVAGERVGRFSADRQLTLLDHLSDEVSARRVRPVLFSTALNQGAGGAAQGVHRSLLAAGAQSRLIFRHLISDWKSIPSVEPFRDAPRHMGDLVHPNGAFLRKDHTIFSIDTDGIPLTELQRLVADADIVNLHWYARFLSNDNIAWLSNCGTPLVFTIRDMHPLTGGCHFFHDCDNWKQSCLPCPQLQPHTIPLPHAQFEQKRLDWNFDNISVVTLSDHTKAIVEQSPLFGGCRVETIPNPVNTAIFRPIAKADARALLNLPANQHIIAYLPSFDSAIKGAAEFQQVLQRLGKDMRHDEVIVICAGRRKVDISAPFAIHQLGHIADKDRLAAFFAAADVTVIPSLEETFSNTAAESLACGTPIAGFATGAIATLAQGERGTAVPVGDIVALARAIEAILTASDSSEPMRLHNYIVDHHSPETIGAAYLRYFSEIMMRPVSRREPSDRGSALVVREYLASRLAAAERVAKDLAPNNGQNPGVGPDLAASRIERFIPEKLGMLQWEVRPNFKTTEGVSVNSNSLLISANGRAEHRVYGPNSYLSAGRYSVEVGIGGAQRSLFSRWLRRSRAVVEVVWNVDTVLASKTFEIGRSLHNQFSWRETFEITANLEAAYAQGLEIRIWTDGRQPWRLKKTVVIKHDLT